MRAAAVLWAEVGGLNLVELLDLTPCLVANRAGDVDFELQKGHKKLLIVDFRLLIEKQVVCSLLFSQQSAITQSTMPF